MGGRADGVEWDESAIARSPLLALDLDRRIEVRGAAPVPVFRVIVVTLGSPPAPVLR